MGDKLPATVGRIADWMWNQTTIEGELNETQNINNDINAGLRRLQLGQ